MDNETEGLQVPRPVVEILLPPDYTCSVVGNGQADPENASDIFASSPVL